MGAKLARYKLCSGGQSLGAPVRSAATLGLVGSRLEIWVNAGYRKFNFDYSLVGRFRIKKFEYSRWIFGVILNPF